MIRRFGLGDLARVVSGNNKGIVVEIIEVLPPGTVRAVTGENRDYIVAVPDGSFLLSDSETQTGEYPYLFCEDWELEPLKGDDEDDSREIDKVVEWDDCQWQPNKVEEPA